MAELNAKQARFVAEYLVDLNATQAAIRAGYSKKTADVQGSRLLGNVDVQRLIESGKAKRADRVQVTADDVLRELLRIAKADISKAFDEEGRLLKLHDIPEDTRLAMSGVEVEEIWDGHGADRVECGETKKVKFWDKPRALELLGKHLGLYTDKLEHSGNLSVRVAINRSVKGGK